ncbi:MAG TPA: sigma factor-like helix-turn-helix DNA-binding protein [Trebonia sp.]|nr:sigma factor-like helix-turn-helix DNA-binding protein [Trebonia sp.]
MNDTVNDTAGDREPTVVRDRPVLDLSRLTSPAQLAGIGHAVLSAERAAVVGAAIRRLPEAQRVTLALSAAGGLTSAEIGAALGIPPGTARYRLSLARRALASALGDYDDPDYDEPYDDQPREER